MTKKKPETATEFINKILAKCKGKVCIFRGTTQIFSTQENVTGKKDGINSSLYRWATQKNNKVAFHENYFPQDIEKDIVDKAKRLFPSAASNTEMLTEIQHYGGKTNCIDFTRSPYVALFFACNGHFKRRGELIMLDTKGPTPVAEIDYQERPPKPIEIIKPTITHTSKPRVTFQASIFVRSQKGYLDINSDMLETEAIPTRLKKPILEYLNKYCSINIDSVYNDLIGFIANEKNFETAAIYFYRGLSYDNNREYHLAIENYTLVIKLNPNLFEAYYNRGAAHLELKHYQDAIEDFTKSTDLNPNDADAYYNRGITHAELEHHQEALQDYSKSIECNPSFAEAYCNRGIVHAKLEHYQEAIKDYDKAIELNPNHAGSYYNRGVAHGKLTHHQKAIEDFTKTIHINSNHAEAYNNRGNVHAELDKHQEAIQDYTKATTINPDFAEAYYNRGTLHAELEHYQEAIQDFNKAVHLNSNHAQAFFFRGIMYQVAGKHKKAKQDFEKAHRLDPHRFPLPSNNDPQK